MKFRFTISKKLGLGFGMLTVLYLLIALFIYQKLESSKEKNNLIISIFEPSVDNLGKMQNMVSDSRMLLKSWVFVERDSLTPDKLNLLGILKFQFPPIQDSILKFYHQWPSQEQLMFDNIRSLINDSLIVLHKKYYWSFLISLRHMMIKYSWHSTRIC